MLTGDLRSQIDGIWNSFWSGGISNPLEVIRRLVGLDRAAAKDAFAGFLDDKRYNANQIEFLNLVIDELTQNGVIEPRRFYESPSTDLDPQGPDAIFESSDVDRRLDVVAEVRRRAEAA